VILCSAVKSLWCESLVAEEKKRRVAALLKELLCAKSEDAPRTRTDLPVCQQRLKIAQLTAISETNTSS
jgi:hypothetical protein